MHIYTADPHFGHTNILSHAKRPFTSIEEMDGAILRAYQEAVGPNDDLWMVGDFAWNKRIAQAMFAQIPGRKHLVSGNHDTRIKSLGWASVHDIAEVEDGGQHFVLCHYPMITWSRSRYGVKHLFGHVHQNWAGSNRAINIGVDWWDFKPTTKPAILERAATLGTHPGWSETEPGAA